EIPDKILFEKHKTSLLHHDIYIDAILGTGLKSEVRGIFKDMIEFLNDSGKPVFAVDIPSGLNADTGQPNGCCVKAQITATFAFPKIGHMLFPGASYTGILEIITIGIPPHIADGVAPSQYILTTDMVKKYFQPRSPDAHKGTTGHLLVISGSPGKTGAAALTVKSAMRSGAGLVTLGIPASLNPILEAQTTEAMTYLLPEDKTGSLSVSSFKSIKNLINGKKCMAIGPGLGNTDGITKLISKIIHECEIPLVIDADGLNCIEGNVNLLKNKKCPIILTPHPGEMAKLTGASIKSIQNDRITSARVFAQKFNVHVVLKGARTVIAHPNGEIFINPTGNPGMASGGMGDVLTGIIGGFVTQGYAPEAATHMGVYLHGASADTLSREYGPVGFLATDIIDALPAEIGKLIS
ncbi:MAG: NAD(P)H-hydrate dehydratase, partial [Desulfobacterales bacterium]|nr:NAD(P)H-hydrate dehydratase [Desulfobacterales bacterium]